MSQLFARHLIHRLVLFAVFVLTLSFNPVSAQSKTTHAVPSARADLTAEDAATFLDGLISARLELERIPGAVVIVVQDGKILFAQGYGMADVENARPVDAETTLFRLASVSKVITATAVMQLVEQGKIDLHADVNTYLDFTIPATYAAPITVLDLIDHTAGFEDWYIGSAAHVGDVIPSLATVLFDHMPDRIYAPTTVTAYSNYGMSLAGYIVERVSGLPFEQYVQQNIFAPLGMAHSTVIQPIPASLESGGATNYQWVEDHLDMYPFEIILTPPSGGMSASGIDMGRFMLAQLSDSSPILSAATLELMHSRSFSNDARVNGVAHGFWEQLSFGKRWLVHGGDLDASESQLALLPEEGVGLFFAINEQSPAANTLRTDVLTGFIERYFGADVPPILATTLDTAVKPDALVGRYVSTRTMSSTVDKLGVLLGLIPTVTVTTAPNNALSSDGETYIETEPLVYQSVNERGHGATLVFVANTDGSYGLLANLMPAMAFRQPPWYETPVINAMLVVFSLSIALLTLIIGTASVRRLTLASGTAYALCLLITLIVIGLVLVLRDPRAVAYGVPPMLSVVALLTLVLVAVLVMLIGLTMRAWLRRDMHLPLRVHYLLVVLGGLSFVFFLNTWNLLGFRA